MKDYVRKLGRLVEQNNSSMKAKLLEVKYGEFLNLFFLHCFI
jgi:hypothetical protein